MHYNKIFSAKSIFKVYNIIDVGNNTYEKILKAYSKKKITQPAMSQKIAVLKKYKLIKVVVNEKCKRKNYYLSTGKKGLDYVSKKYLEEKQKKIGVPENFEGYFILINARQGKLFYKEKAVK